MPISRTTRRRLLRWSLIPALAPLLPAAPRHVAAATDLGALLAETAATMRGLTTYHFELTFEAGKTTLWEEIEIRKAAGDIVRPDRFRAKIEAKLGPLSVAVEVVSIAGEIWVTLAGIDRQVGIGADVAAILLDPTVILIGALETIQEPKLAAIEERDGQRTTRITGRFDPTKLSDASVAPFLKQTEPMPVELTIDAQGYVVELLLSGPLIRADSADVVRRMTLSSFDDEIEIAAPD